MRHQCLVEDCDRAAIFCGAHVQTELERAQQALREIRKLARMFLNTGEQFQAYDTSIVRHIEMQALGDVPLTKQNKREK